MALSSSWCSFVVPLVKLPNQFTQSRNVTDITPSPSPYIVWHIWISISAWYKRLGFGSRYFGRILMSCCIRIRNLYFFSHQFFIANIQSIPNFVQTYLDTDPGFFIRSRSWVLKAGSRSIIISKEPVSNTLPITSEGHYNLW